MSPKKAGAMEINSQTTQVTAIRALAAARRHAEKLTPFITPAAVLVDDETGPNDQVLFAVNELSKKFFAGGLDFEEAVSERKADELVDLYVDEVYAQVKAAFALGVAFGRLGGASR